MSALFVASARLSKLSILCVNDILDGDLREKYLYFRISLFFSFSNMILSDALILPIPQLQAQQVMTSQIRSHIEYLIQMYYILFSFCRKNEQFSLNDGFNTI